MRVAGLLFASDRAGAAAGGQPVLGLPSLWAPMETWRERLILLVGTVGVPMVGVAVYLALFQGEASLVLGRALGYN